MSVGVVAVSLMCGTNTQLYVGVVRTCDFDLYVFATRRQLGDDLT